MLWPMTLADRHAQFLVVMTMVAITSTYVVWVDRTASLRKLGVGGRVLCRPNAFMSSCAHTFVNIEHSLGRCRNPSLGSESLSVKHGCLSPAYLPEPIIGALLPLIVGKLVPL